MQQIPLDIKINPSTHPSIEQWREELLWHPMTKDDIVDFIRTHIQSDPDVKSGTVLYRDFQLNSFQQIAFRQKRILQPEDACAIVKLKRPDPVKPPVTFEEKTKLLSAFIAEKGRVPEEGDEFEDVNLLTFYKSLIRGRDKYTNIIEGCKSHPSDDGSAENAVARGTDGGALLRGRGRVDGGRGSSDDVAHSSDTDENAESIPVPKKSTKKSTK